MNPLRGCTITKKHKNSRATAHHLLTDPKHYLIEMNSIEMCTKRCPEKPTSSVAEGANEETRHDCNASGLGLTNAVSLICVIFFEISASFAQTPAYDPGSEIKGVPTQIDTLAHNVCFLFSKIVHEDSQNP
jgi:hypothetical protein